MNAARQPKASVMKPPRGPPRAPPSCRVEKDQFDCQRKTVTPTHRPNRSRNRAHQAPLLQWEQIANDDTSRSHNPSSSSTSNEPSSDQPFHARRQSAESRAEGEEKDG